MMASESLVTVSPSSYGMPVSGINGVIRGVRDFLGLCQDVASLVFGDGAPAVEKWGL